MTYEEVELEKWRQLWWISRMIAPSHGDPAVRECKAVLPHSTGVRRISQYETWYASMARRHARVEKVVLSA
jgi:hypothetical protein